MLLVARKILPNGSQHNVQINSKVLVDENIPDSRHAVPRYVGVLLAEIGVEVLRRLSDTDLYHSK